METIYYSNIRKVGKRWAVDIIEGLNISTVYATYKRDIIYHIKRLGYIAA